MKANWKKYKTERPDNLLTGDAVWVVRDGYIGVSVAYAEIVDYRNDKGFWGYFKDRYGYEMNGIKAWAEIEYPEPPED